MLIAEIHTVAGVMLGTGSHTCGLHRIHIGFGHLLDPLHIGAEGANIGDRIAEIDIQIADGRIGDIHANTSSLFAADLSKAGSFLRIIRRCSQQGPAVESAITHTAGAALFQVGSLQQRNLRDLVQRGVISANFLAGLNRAEQDTANTPLGNHSLQSLIGIIATHDDKQLTDFLFDRETSTGGFHPGNLLIIQEERRFS